MLIASLWCFTGAWAGVALDGTDDLLTAGDIAALNLTDTTVTVSCWMKGTTTGATAYFVAKFAADSNTGWFLRISSAGALTARIVGNSSQTSSQRTSTSSVLLDGAWHHVAAIFTTDTTTAANNEVTLYIDGSLDQGTETADGIVYSPGTGVDFHLGARAGPSSFLQGTIATCTLFNGSLTVNEIETLAFGRLLNPSLSRALTAQWLIDECGDGAAGNGVTAVDRSGNGRHLTIDDGANNTGATCAAAERLSYSGGVR